ncbi:ATP synthase F1 subunit delta [Chitinophagaceae bacterium LWZ2-11]
MRNPRLADRYAKSLIDLAIEKNQLESVYADMQYISAVCKSSDEFSSLLASPIIKADKKNAVLTALTKGKVNVITETFNTLLVNKGREAVLPEIAEAFIDQYFVLKGIHKVKLTTATSVGEEVKKAIEAKIQTSDIKGSIHLETKVDEKLIGGFVLEFDNNIVDASVAKALNDIKKQFASNYYINKLQ